MKKLKRKLKSKKPNSKKPSEPVVPEPETKQKKKRFRNLLLYQEEGLDLRSLKEGDPVVLELSGLQGGRSLSVWACLIAKREKYRWTLYRMSMYPPYEKIILRAKYDGIKYGKHKVNLHIVGMPWATAEKVNADVLKVKAWLREKDEAKVKSNDVSSMTWREKEKYWKRIAEKEAARRERKGKTLVLHFAAVPEEGVCRFPKRLLDQSGTWKYWGDDPLETRPPVKKLANGDSSAEDWLFNPHWKTKVVNGNEVIDIGRFAKSERSRKTFETLQTRLSRALGVNRTLVGYSEAKRKEIARKEAEDLPIEVSCLVVWPPGDSVPPPLYGHRYRTVSLSDALAQWPLEVKAGYVKSSKSGKAWEIVVTKAKKRIVIQLRKIGSQEIVKERVVNL